MRKLACIALLVAAMPLVAMAQDAPAVDASVGYSFFHLGSGVSGVSGSNQNGVSGSAAYNLNNWFGAVADFGGYHSSPFNVGLTTFTYMFGPRVTYRTDGKVSPFGQFLLGGGHMSASAYGTSGAVNAFAYSLGGGADFKVSDNASFRPQVDYVGLRTSGSTLNCVRISAAIVFHFGQANH